MRCVWSLQLNKKKISKCIKMFQKSENTVLVIVNPHVIQIFDKFGLLICLLFSQ